MKFWLMINSGDGDRVLTRPTGTLCGFRTGGSKI